MAGSGKNEERYVPRAGTRGRKTLRRESNSRYNFAGPAGNLNCCEPNMLNFSAVFLPRTIRVSALFLWSPYLFVLRMLTVDVVVVVVHSQRVLIIPQWECLLDKLYPLSGCCDFWWKMHVYA